MGVPLRDVNCELLEPGATLESEVGKRLSKTRQSP